MVFNRHLKALNLCNHSDTIACVLYELLVCLELFNVIFHHDQGSTSFSFVQFSRSCCAVLTGCPPDSLYIIPPPQAFVNTFFQISTKLNSKLICSGYSHENILFAVVLFWCSSYIHNISTYFACSSHKWSGLHGGFLLYNGDIPIIKEGRQDDTWETAEPNCRLYTL